MWSFDYATYHVLPIPNRLIAFSYTGSKQTPVQTFSLDVIVISAVSCYKIWYVKIVIFLDLDHQEYISE